MPELVVSIENMFGNIEFSIVIPVYNRSSYLQSTFESVLAQTYRPLQLILVDNNSADNSLELCKAFQAEHQSDSFRVQVLEQPKKGAACARNMGALHCDTPYLYFFDSDDEMSPDFVATVLPEIKKRQLDVLGVKTCVCTSSGCAVRDRIYSASPAVQILAGIFPTQAAVYRTEFFKKIMWNETLLTWDDWEMAVRMLLVRPRMEWITGRAFHHIYVHDESITGSSFSSTYQWIDKALSAVEDVVRNGGFDAQETKRCLLALFYRRQILAGWLFREGSMELAKHCLLQGKALRLIAVGHRLCGQAIYHYTRVGGRGAWRLALPFFS